jgi:hypothetical protein
MAEDHGLDDSGILHRDENGDAVFAHEEELVVEQPENGPSQRGRKRNVPQEKQVFSKNFSSQLMSALANAAESADYARDENKKMKEVVQAVFDGLDQVINLILLDWASISKVHFPCHSVCRMRNSS